MRNSGCPKTTLLTVAKDLDVESEGADVLSDLFGFCVNWFNFEVVEQNGGHQVVRFYDR